MDYSLELITTIEDCDALITKAIDEGKDLGVRKHQQEKQYKGVTTGTVDIDADLIGINAEITALEAVLLALAPGDIKAEYDSKLIKAKHQKFLLEERKEKYGHLALIEKEYVIACIDRELLENQDYLEALYARKDEL